MKRYFVILSVLLCSLAWGQTKTPSCGAKLSGVIHNVARPIELTSLCTPQRTGQYSLKLNMVVNRDEGSFATTTATFHWYDGATNESTMLSIASNADTPNCSVWSEPILVTAAQTPITYSFDKDGVDKAQVTLYWTLNLEQPMRTF